MNTLELRLVPHSESATDYLLSEVWIDGDIPLGNYREYAIDLEELRRSVGNAGDFWIITCWCGDPGCAGIDQAVKVVQEADIVHWYIEEPPPARHLMFSRGQYEAAIRDALETCRRWVPQRPYIGGRSLEITPAQNAIFFDAATPTLPPLPQT